MVSSNRPPGFCDGAQVMGEEAQVEVAEGAALSPRPQITGQFAQVVVPACLVLGIELNYPGVLVEFVEGILQRVLQRIACLPQPGQFAPFGADRGQLEEGRHGLAVLEQHALRLRQVFHPGQQIGEGWRHLVERLGVLFGGRLAAPNAAGFADAVCGQPCHMPRPGIVGWPVLGDRRRGLAQEGERHGPGHQ